MRDSYRGRGRKKSIHDCGQMREKKGYNTCNTCKLRLRGREKEGEERRETGQEKKGNKYREMEEGRRGRRSGRQEPPR